METSEMGLGTAASPTAGQYEPDLAPPTAPEVEVASMPWAHAPAGTAGSPALPTMTATPPGPAQPYGDMRWLEGRATRRDLHQVLAASRMYGGDTWERDYQPAAALTAQLEGVQAYAGHDARLAAHLDAAPTPQEVDAAFGSLGRAIVNIPESEGHSPEARAIRAFVMGADAGRLTAEQRVMMGRRYHLLELSVDQPEHPAVRAYGAALRERMVDIGAMPAPAAPTAHGQPHGQEAAALDAPDGWSGLALMEQVSGAAARRDQELQQYYASQEEQQRANAARLAEATAAMRQQSAGRRRR